MTRRNAAMPTPASTAAPLLLPWPMAPLKFEPGELYLVTGLVALFTSYLQVTFPGTTLYTDRRLPSKPRPLAEFFPVLPQTGTLAVLKKDYAFDIYCVETAEGDTEATLDTRRDNVVLQWLDKRPNYPVVVALPEPFSRVFYDRAAAVIELRQYIMPPGAGRDHATHAAWVSTHPHREVNVQLLRYKSRTLLPYGRLQ